MFARTCPGGWVTMLPADTRRHTSLQPEADTSGCSLHRATRNLLRETHVRAGLPGSFFGGGVKSEEETLCSELLSFYLFSNS